MDQARRSRVLVLRALPLARPPARRWCDLAPAPLTASDQNPPSLLGRVGPDYLRNDSDCDTYGIVLLQLKIWRGRFFDWSLCGGQLIGHRCEEVLPFYIGGELAKVFRPWVQAYSLSDDLQSIS